MRESGQLQDSFASIHVGGTNGKGSTVAMVASVLRRAGLKTGRFTGPHLLRWNERFHVDGLPIPDEEFADLATRIRALSEDFGKRYPEFGPLTWFEFLTAMAFFLFAERGVDVAIFEVGLGGRWDATNVLSSPLAVGITNVDLDHTQILGETLRQIASEKSGIIKAGVPVVTACAGEALEVVAGVAEERKAPLIHCQPPDVVSLTEPGKEPRSISSYMDFHLAELQGARKRLSLAGSHQQLNALVALGLVAASGLLRQFHGYLPEVVGDGLAGVYWPGRMQLVDGAGLVLDGAHNPAGALALRRALDEGFPARRRLFVLGCFQNKNAERFIFNLLRPGDRLFACEPSAKRPVHSAESIARMAVAVGAVASAPGSVVAGLRRALAYRRHDDIVVVTGSFATVKECMLQLGWQSVEDGLSGAPALATGALICNGIL
jgi:dihydrofolate synthase/folylpolyglutamate synthase